MPLSKPTFARPLLPLALLLALSASPALADSIDGDWCLAASHFRIEGPTITTPGGNRIQGSYSRHDYSYVVPASEPGAGGEVRMRLLNEETVELSRAAATSSETWKRCKPIS